MESCFFSIVVPVYNVANELARCVNSVLNQKIESQYEIILVDDGSTDNSGNICDDFASSQSKVSVFHKKNGGLSDARNYGLQKSKGKYIVFLDSDDIIAPDTLATFSKILSTTEVDVLFGKVKEVKGEQVTFYIKQNIVYNKIYKGTDFLKAELKSGSLQALAPIGIYKRDFLLKENLFFKKGILHEDEEWSPRVLLKAQKVTCIDFTHYVYFIRPNSITQKRDKTKNSQDLIETAYFLDKLFSNIEDIELKRLYLAYLAKLYMNAVSQCILHGNIDVLQPLLNNNFIKHRWITFSDFLKIQIFKMSPRFYANLLEKANNR